jgi:hypothetical protein
MKNGRNGLPGKPGNNGGNFFAFAPKQIGVESLEVLLNGGRGGAGEAAGNGEDGSSTIDLDFKNLTGSKLEKKLGEDKYIVRQEEHKWSDMNSGKQKTLQFLRQVGTFNDVYDTTYHVKS